MIEIVTSSVSDSSRSHLNLRGRSMEGPHRRQKGLVGVRPSRAELVVLSLPMLVKGNKDVNEVCALGAKSVAKKFFDDATARVTSS